MFHLIECIDWLTKYLQKTCLLCDNQQCLKQQSDGQFYERLGITGTTDKLSAAALTFAAPNVVPLTPTKSVSHVTNFPTKLTGSYTSPRYTAIKVATVSYETSTVDYNSALSVFPAEACETIGGEACLADIYPEVRLQPEARSDTPRVTSDNVERDYLEYDDPKTVFIGEACDDLGGIFCGLEYQRVNPKPKTPKLISSSPSTLSAASSFFSLNSLRRVLLLLPLCSSSCPLLLLVLEFFFTALDFVFFSRVRLLTRRHEFDFFFAEREKPHSPRRTSSSSASACPPTSDIDFDLRWR
ncbi:hypothetical protein RIF29_20837 [Crotalaria pallida]|uniref:Uncharacterized protein n=1 Tax=Crotalaria pallida TaxID=3830 RepID=A0AAN9I910_CROPI